MIFQSQQDRDRCQVMGVLNITPDSFYSGSRVMTVDQAVQRAWEMIEAGVDCLDIGGESTRPGALPVSADQQCERVIPIIEALSQRFDRPISIDTADPTVMEAALVAGASMINDIYALTQPGTLAVAARSDVPICLMHMQGAPRTMQQDPHYDDVIEDIACFFESRIEACLVAGITKERLILDPGFGFGKTDQHNLILTKYLSAFKRFQLPILLGVSRKSSLGRLLGREPEDRLSGGLALTVFAIQQGVSIIRTHDVAETIDVIKIMQAIDRINR